MANSGGRLRRGSTLAKSKVIVSQQMSVGTTPTGAILKRGRYCVNKGNKVAVVLRICSCYTCSKLLATEEPESGCSDQSQEAVQYSYRSCCSVKVDDGPAHSL